MPAVIKWRAAFKEIYGRTPTKNDYELAPGQVKEEFFSECPPSPSVQKQEALPHRRGVRLKRPLEDESPLKRRPPKARRLCKDQPVQGVRSSPRKNVHGTPSFLLSPVKSSSAVPRSSGSRRALTTLKEVQPSTSLSSLPPTKLQGLASPIKRVAALSGFTSLFDTPEKGQSAAWGEISPQKTFIPPATLGTPIRSPRKPLVHKEVLVENVECLLLPTPEKRIRKEVLTPFEPEEVPSKKPSAGQSKSEVAVAFDPKTGKVLKRAFKRTTPAIPRKKNEKGNYVRINMKKKSFSRGKVSAEQKRKMRRKQNWKRRFAGGGG